MIFPRLLVALAFAWLLPLAPLAAQAPAQANSSTPLSARSVRNLAAFVRLYGYIRFFHPSHEGLQADWNAIAVDGARRAENASSPAELARSLRETFATVAPTVRVFQSGRPGPRASAPRVPNASVRGVAFWRHHGVRAGTLDLYKGALYRSEIVVVPARRPRPQ